MTPPKSIEIRPYEDADEPAVLMLLKASLGAGPTGERSSSLFRWKHIDNPFGRSYMFVAQRSGEIVGFRAFMQWRFHTADGLARAVRAVDTATHPSAQRQGIFSAITRHALQAIRPEVSFVFNTPNEKSLPGYLKLGWKEVGRIPVSLRVSRPIKLIARLALSSASLRAEEEDGRSQAAEVALGDETPVEDLCRRAENKDGRLHTPRDGKYLRWRYGGSPLDYRVMTFESGGKMEGLTIFRARRRGRTWEAPVTELIATSQGVANALLKAVVSVAPVDHLICHFPPGSIARSSATRRGFLPVPGGITLVVNPLQEDLQADPSSSDAWSLSLGDLEVF